MTVMTQPSASTGQAPVNRPFAPAEVHRPRGDAAGRQDVGDQRSAPVYVYHESIVLAVNVALATGRPLLVRGPSGAGKSTLARNAADVLGWRYYEEVVTSRTQARDLLWRVDLVRRLHEAHREGGKLDEDYTPFIEPGVLWWSFDPASAQRRGADPGAARVRPPAHKVAGKSGATRAVVLLDEIDKADPDVPNNLLVPLGSLRFQVDETGATVRADREHAPLVMITTNGERDLPAAFLRRCVSVDLPPSGFARLADIVTAHFEKLSREQARGYVEAVVECFPESKQRLDEERQRAAAAGEAERPVDLVLSPAEVVDAVRAALSLGIPIPGSEWSAVVAACTSGQRERGT